MKRFKLFFTRMEWNEETNFSVVVLTIAAYTIDGPIGCFEVGRPGSGDNDVLHVPPRQLGVGFKGKGADPSCQRSRGWCPGVTARALLVKISCNHLQNDNWYFRNIFFFIVDNRLKRSICSELIWLFLTNGYSL
jgi:hypothetical protein